ncbi:MAG: hypothetical protein JWN86_888 [Planctomycetota bacterium]|nr:hypothetical protein [Planctomycetota bacterium]
MILSTNFEHRLRDRLHIVAGREARVDVVPADPASYKYFGLIVSPAFVGLNEGQRQFLVWDQLLKTFSEEELRRVEFVSTRTPAEANNSADVAEVSTAPPTSR